MTKTLSRKAQEADKWRRAGLKAWKTRRANEAARQAAAEAERRKWHLAGKKAWETRRRNSQSV